MSGHSKWAQIKRQKGTADLKKGIAFTKLANAITIAAREGGPDPAINFRLRLTIEKARAANMPKDNVERAIKRGSGEATDRPMATVTYEGYGPGGIAVVVEALTDNRHRTAGELRRVFTEYGGRLGHTNSVRWMFARRGFVEVKRNANREAVELAAIDAGAADVVEEGDSVIVYTSPTALAAVRDAVTAAGAEVLNAELALVPTTVMAPPADQREKVTDFLLALEDLQDINDVATNAAI
ncbi:MAG: YebC/PmpR family DNA-binding transcriptional regulator [Candidatus Kerfeldbacteria bacterium]|nr:YebC/PmpR family DNA-binding transcriptional regulator [Candidatus Kerfeldbacteria bacterium]